MVKICGYALWYCVSWDFSEYISKGITIHMYNADRNFNKKSVKNVVGISFRCTFVKTDFFILMARKYLFEELGVNSLAVTHIVHSRVYDRGDKVIEREVDSFVRFYDSAYNRKRLMSLSGGAKGLLLYASMCLCYGENYVEINVKQYMREEGVKGLTTYREYVRELIDANIFARTKIVDVFYFDHNLFFKGSRVNNLDNALVINNG